MSETSSSTSRSSRWFRFTIGSLLILVLGISIGFVPSQLAGLRKPPQPQILVHLQLVDVDRDSLSTLGIDPANLSRGAVAARSADDSVSARVESLRKANQATKVAELTMAVANGRKATFHCGGELRIPVAPNGEVTHVELKEVGTRVDLLPTVLKDGGTRLSISPNIVELDNTRSVNIAGTSVPGLRTRFSRELEFDVANGETVVVGAFPLQPKTEAIVTLAVASVEMFETR